MKVKKNIPAKLFPFQWNGISWKRKTYNSIFNKKLFLYYTLRSRRKLFNILLNAITAFGQHDSRNRTEKNIKTLINQTLKLFNLFKSYVINKKRKLRILTNLVIFSELNIIDVNQFLLIIKKQEVRFMV